ncbi:hypothetical protein F3Y22_tig00110419pilonHSYRG00155 [Hibiscus syriacus]|uniref:Uncharacterized protein n=1 Tax=Hibiscus syriacus TaxID=106335 RepID=A0A6A3AQN5_HIBSY|nr:hypothetical protein F3Y22_tig00110419pilonHSYRG00155 [Hibiscus syriacus]
MVVLFNTSIGVGPGCSSLGFGAFMEQGPFQPGDVNLVKIHIDGIWSPIGVGFSYSNTSSDCIGVKLNDTSTGEFNMK